MSNSGLPSHKADLMMHPNRAKMLDKVLEKLMFSLTNDI